MTHTTPESQETQAERDYRLWQDYLVSCERDGTKPTLSGYLVWLEDNDVDTAP